MLNSYHHPDVKHECLSVDILELDCNVYKTPIINGLPHLPHTITMQVEPAPTHDSEIREKHHRL